MTRDDIHEKFKDIDVLARNTPFGQDATVSLLLKGEAQQCRAPHGANPTYNVKGWKGPCYLITDGHYKTFEELMTQTPWESYGAGRDTPL